MAANIIIMESVINKFNKLNPDEYRVAEYS